MTRSLAWCFALMTLAAVAGVFSWRPVSAITGGRTLAVVYPMPSVGVAATHLLQVNLANVSRPHADSGRTTLVVQARLLDTHGVELARSESQTLPLGATFSWTIKPADLAGALGDERGRIQVRSEIGVVGTVRVGAFVPSLELVNESTGEGSGMIGDVRTVISGNAAYASANAMFPPQP